MSTLPVPPSKGGGVVADDAGAAADTGSDTVIALAGG